MLQDTITYNEEIWGACLFATFLPPFFILLRRRAVGLFSGPEEELEFIRDRDLDIAEVNILVEAGKYREAADLHIRENRVFDAVDVLLKDNNSGEAMQLATQRLLEALWSILSFGVMHDSLSGDASANLRKTRQLIQRLDLQSLDPKTQQEVEFLHPSSSLQLTDSQFQIFEAIRDANTAQLMDLGRIFYQHGNKPAALLCLDHSFQNFNTKILQSYSSSEILTMASALHGYALLIQEIHILPDPWDKRPIQKLFSFSIQSSGRICLPRGTFLHDCAPRFLRLPPSDDIAVEARDFYHIYRSALRERLRKLLDAYCDGCLYVRVFDPCEAFAAGRCERVDCTRQHKLDRAWFDARLGFHLRLVDFSNLLQFFGGDLHHQRFVSKLRSTHHAYRTL